MILIKKYIRWLTMLVLYMQLPHSLVYSQTDGWSKVMIDDKLTVSFPGKLFTADTTLLIDKTKMSYRVSKASSNLTDFVLSVSNKKLGITTSEALAKAYNDMDEGIKRNAAKRGLECTIIDTFINQLHCKKTELLSNDPLKTTKVISWLFILDDKIYNVSAFASHGQSEQSDKEMRTMFNSIHFNAAAVQPLPSRAEILAYKAGQLLGFGLVAGIAGLLIFFIVHKKNKRYH